MIQAGAGELHCVEMNPNMFRQAQLVRSVTEQLEGRTLTTPPPEQVVTRYHPPRELLEQLEEAILTVRVNHGRAVGELSLNPRETSLREKLKALTVTEYQVFPLLFEPDELLTMDGHPDMEAALPRLREILEEALVLPDNERNRLLRRASGTDRTRSDSLLRPFDELPSEGESAPSEG